MAAQKLTAEQIIEALQATQGLPAMAAERLGVTTQTLYNYRDRYKSVAEAMHHQKEKRIDFVEGKLWKRINDEDTTAIIFYLKTQAKSRGYIEKLIQDINVNVGDLSDEQLQAIVNAKSGG